MESSDANKSPLPRRAGSQPAPQGPATPDDLDPAADVRQLLQSDAGRAALEHVRAICEGPALDDRNQYAVVALLTAYWAGRAGSVLAALRRAT